MPWDSQPLSSPRLECVFTLDNTSDSETRWEKSDGSIASKWMPPNSILLVQAEGASHGVTAVNKGDRSIAKFVLTASPIKLQSWYDNMDSYRAASSKKASAPQP